MSEFTILDYQHSPGGTVTPAQKTGIETAQSTQKSIEDSQLFLDLQKLYISEQGPVPVVDGQTDYEYSTTIPGYLMTSYGDPTKELGKGAYGKVDAYGSFAIKTFFDVSTSNAVSTSTLREISILLRCNHPNIVEVSDIVRTINDGVQKGVTLRTYEYHLVMPIANTTLHDFLKKGSAGKVVSNEVILDLGRQLIGAVSYLQTRNIMHRDIKPANVLIYEQTNGLCTIYNARLADFGLAMTYGCKIPKGITDVVYTLPYMPPEIMLANIKKTKVPYDMKADTWALGCTLYELFVRLIPALFTPPRNIKYELEQAYVDWCKSKLTAPATWRVLLQAVGKTTANLVRTMLTYDQEQRPYVFELLGDTAFSGLPEDPNADLHTGDLTCTDAVNLRCCQPVPSEYIMDYEVWTELTYWVWELTSLIKQKTDQGSGIYYHTIWLFDAYVAIDDLPRSEEYGLYLAAAFLIASAYHGRNVSISAIQIKTKNQYTNDQIRFAVSDLLVTIKYDIAQNTCYNHFIDLRKTSPNVDVFGTDVFMFILTTSPVRYVLTAYELAHTAIEMLELHEKDQLIPYIYKTSTVNIKNPILQKYRDDIRLAMDLTLPYIKDLVKVDA